MADLSRLLQPKSIAVIGGGVWCKNVIEQCQKAGFTGPIWPVHPNAETMHGLPCFPSIEALPNPPDASFIGVNRFATVETVTKLSRIGAGGAVCFASGFLEASAEDENGADLQDQLVHAAGVMPILGPNCYGFINYLDGALLWPDQHGGVQVKSGVAIITQSSNIAINLTMQRRGLPIAYVVTAGNQSQQSIGAIGAALLNDPRVTALGLHIEGFSDLPALEKLAAKARKLCKRIVALKVGKSAQAQTATISHTASLAGSDAGGQALLNRLGIARVGSLAGLLEALKLLHITGPLASNNIASISCSGGEASLMADAALPFNLNFPALTAAQIASLAKALGPMVSLANPLDYHTYIWGDADAMAKAFAAIMQPPVALTVLIVDFPHEIHCNADAWECVLAAAENCAKISEIPIAMLASLPENMPEPVTARLAKAGIAPLMGLTEGLEAIEAGSFQPSPPAPPVLLSQAVENPETFSESISKQILAEFGVKIPKSASATSPKFAAQAANKIGFPVALKGVGIAHKTEMGAVHLNLNSAAAVQSAAENMPCTDFLVEEMITNPAVEMLIGVINDPAHGYVLTLGAGGVLTELLQDSQSLLIPTDFATIRKAIQKLRISKLLHGYRGAAGANIEEIIETALAVQNFVLANADKIEEIEINPLICTPQNAIAADALIHMQKENP